MEPIATASTKSGRMNAYAMKDSVETPSEGVKVFLLLQFDEVIVLTHSL